MNQPEEETRTEAMESDDFLPRSAEWQPLTKLEGSIEENVVTVNWGQKKKKEFAPIITDFEHIHEVLEEQGIPYDGSIRREEISFCKLEAQQDCMLGNLCIPKLKDTEGEKFRLAFVVTKEQMILVDDAGFAKRIIDRMEKGNAKLYKSKERFLYYFITEYMSQDLVLMNQIENLLMELEMEILNGEHDDENNRLAMFRRKLLVLRCYYDEMADLGRALEENENGYFRKGQLKYFGIISDRADRLMNRAMHLLDLGRQVKETQQSQIDARQNSNMQFLTVLSAVFFPLTLITGWYGMNFQNMPELASGYPFVIVFSGLVVAAVVIIFKMKKLL